MVCSTAIPIWQSASRPTPRLIALATPGDINHFGPEDLAAFEAGMTAGLVR